MALIFFYSWLWGSLTVSLASTYQASTVDLSWDEGFLEPGVDYSRLIARITDVDWSRRWIKISAEHDLLRFLQKGDRLQWKPMKLSQQYCEGVVQHSEIGHASLQVQDFSACWPQGKYLPRGLVVDVSSPYLLLRAQEVSAYRRQLLQNRTQFFSQLATLSPMAIDPAQARLAIDKEFEQKKLALENDRKAALRQWEELQVQQSQEARELKQQIQTLEEQLKFYRIDRRDLLKDRALMDQDLSAPVAKSLPPSTTAGQEQQ